jgi:hypothetical protein
MSMPLQQVERAELERPRVLRKLVPAKERRLSSPLLFAAAMALIVWILVDSMPPALEKPKGDDSYYLHYMDTVASQGPAAFPRLVEHWNSTPVDWRFPPPTRVGFVGISAVWGWLFGTTYRSLQSLSLASFVLLCVLNYVFVRRHFGGSTAFLAGTLLGFSPLLMGLSRLALSDSTAVLWMSASVWMFLEVSRDPTWVPKQVLFMVALTMMVLVKEISVLLVGAYVVFVLYERFVRGVPHDLRRAAVALAVPGAVVLAIQVLAAGGFAPLLETARILLASPGTNRYAIRFGSGPWFRVILDFLLLSPWPTLLAIGWFWITAVRLRTGRFDRTSVYLGLVIASLVFVLSFFTKNVRYASVLEPPIRLFAVLLVRDLFGGLRGRLPRLLTGGVVAILCALDWRSFELIWVENEGFDPVTRFLGMVRRVIPY